MIVSFEFLASYFFCLPLASNKQLALTWLVILCADFVSQKWAELMKRICTESLSIEFNILVMIILSYWLIDISGVSDLTCHVVFHHHRRQTSSTYSIDPRNYATLCECTRDHSKLLLEIRASWSELFVFCVTVPLFSCFVEDCTCMLLSSCLDILIVLANTARAQHVWIIGSQLTVVPRS
jgi:hypothetical protein